MICSKLSTFSNNDCCLRHIACTSWSSFNLVEHIHAISDMTKDTVFAIKMRSGSEAEEELGTICVWAGVGHGEDAPLVMLLVGMAQVFVSELVSIDAFSTSSVTASEITTLCHEPCDDSVEGASFEVKRLSLASLAFLSSAEGSEVLSSVWVCICT